MAELKLQKLPNRTQVKLTVNLPPDVHRSLCAYAAYLNGQLVSLEILARGSRGFLRNFRPFQRIPAGTAVSRTVSAMGAGGGA